MNSADTDRSLTTLKKAVIASVVPKIVGKIHDRYPDAKIEVVDDEIHVYGQQPIDDEFRSRTPWVESTVREALR